MAMDIVSREFFLLQLYIQLAPHSIRPFAQQHNICYLKSDVWVHLKNNNNKWFIALPTVCSLEQKSFVYKI